MKMVSLKLTRKDAKEEVGIPPDLPEYPWGTQLHLDEDEMKKLGLKEMPPVGTEYPIEAVCKVIGTSERETQDGKRATLDVQIIAMAIGDDEEPDTPQGKAAKTLYGKSES